MTSHSRQVLADDNSAPDGVVGALVSLGFSQYEARTYAGLVGLPPVTGYALAKKTQVPQPKVYETLGRLVERGAIVQVGDAPAKFAAISPGRLLSHLEGEFQRRLMAAETEITKFRASGVSADVLRFLHEADSWPELAAQAREMISRCNERLYISGHAEYIEVLGEELAAAEKRGVRIDILCFGRAKLDVSPESIVRHSSTDGIVYSHHQARHLALVCDSAGSMWALARDGLNWEGTWSEDDPLINALVKGFVRHDIFVQIVYRDFGEQLVDTYGAGLEGLFAHGLSDEPVGDAQAASGFLRPA